MSIFFKVFTFSEIEESSRNRSLNYEEHNSFESFSFCLKLFKKEDLNLYNFDFSNLDKLIKLDFKNKLNVYLNDIKQLKLLKNYIPLTQYLNLEKKLAPKAKITEPKLTFYDARTYSYYFLKLTKGLTHSRFIRLYNKLKYCDNVYISKYI